MADLFIDTDVIIRLLTGDDPHRQERASNLFEQVERREHVLSAPDTVIADAVFVLSSPRLYRLPRQQVAALLIPLIRLPGFRVKGRRTIIAVLHLYSSTNIDFGDALIVASMQQAGSGIVYSFDVDFDKIAGVTRREP